MRMRIDKFFSGFRKEGLGQRGLAAVEFALILPVLMAILLVLVEGANALKTQMLLQEATREGARQVLRTSETSGVGELLSSLVSDLPEVDSAFTAYITEDLFSNTINVRVTYDYQSLFFGDMLDAAFEGQQFQLEASTTMPMP